MKNKKNKMKDGEHLVILTSLGLLLLIWRAETILVVCVAALWAAGEFCGLGLSHIREIEAFICISL